MKTALELAALSLGSMLLVPAAHADTFEEELAQLTERFKAADTNGDGKLTQKEAKDGKMSRLVRFFGRVDTDSDGFVTFEQLKSRLEQRYK